MQEENGPWRVQTGYQRGQYRTRYTLNSEAAAKRYYECLNTHSGYKKRILAPDGKVMPGFRYISDGHRLGS